MSNVRKVLGRDLDLDTIQSIWTLERLKKHLPKGMTAVDVAWRIIKKPTDDNLMIRPEGTPDAEDTLGYDLERGGFDVNTLPPTEDIETGEIKDGRTREIEIWKLIQKHNWEPVMPVIRVNIDEGMDRPVAQKSNYHPYAKRAGSLGLEASLIADMQEGLIVPLTKVQLRIRLHNDYEVDNLLSNEGGAITKVINNAWDRFHHGDKVIRNKAEGEWAKWVEEETDYDDVVTLKAGGKAPERFIFRHCIPNGRKDKTTRVILNVNEYTLEKAQAAVKKFKTEVDKAYRDIFILVGKSLGRIIIEPEYGYEIVGICPQVQNDVQKEMYENGELVSYDDYVKVA